MTRSAELPLLIDANLLQQHLAREDLLLLDVSSADNYAQAHIPGALHVAPASLVCGIKPATGKLPDENALTQLMSGLGLSPDKHVIAYDDEGGGWAGRLIWTLDVLGHSHYSYLDGGIRAWQATGLATQKQANSGVATDYQVSIHHEPIIEAEELMALLGETNLAIWDARGPEEFAGTKVLAKRGGHIPGARNYEWTDLMDKQRNLQLLPLQDIQEQLDQRGITRNKRVVTHCQTHHRSGLTYLVARILGYPNIQAYHGSWSEWGNRDDTPIEQ
jgi:thiosulfate/3-mercaptopyruvate sulfurtransferase